MMPTQHHLGIESPLPPRALRGFVAATGAALPRALGIASFVLVAAAAMIAAACDRPSDGAAAGTGSPTTALATADSSGQQRVAIKVTSKGYEPAEVHFVAGKPAVLEFTRVTESECLNAVKMPWMKEAVPLPLNETVKIPVDTKEAGAFAYSCWMSMIYGRVVIDPAK